MFRTLLLLAVLTTSASGAFAQNGTPDPVRLVKLIVSSTSDSMLIDDWHRVRRHLGERYLECAIALEMLPEATSEADVAGLSLVAREVANRLLFDLDAYEFDTAVFSASQSLRRARAEPDDSAFRTLGANCEGLLSERTVSTTAFKLTFAVR